jgi:ComF family protein
VIDRVPRFLEPRIGKSVAPRRYRAAVLDALFPLVCPGCGRPARAGAPVCASCVSRLRAPFPAPPPAAVDAWCAPFAYEGVAREVVARVKYRGARAAVPWLARAMVASIDARRANVDAVTWAPTSPTRRRQRGFDPAELLARAVARHLPARAVGLLDRRPGPPQTGLDADARRRGPRFAARGRLPGAVLLVDDVATTGATLSSAAHALRSAGAHTVLALTAARTPPPGRP